MATTETRPDVQRKIAPAMQRLDLRLQVLELSRRSDLTCVEPLPIALRPRAHLVHVGVDLRLLAPKIAVLGLQQHDIVGRPRQPRLQLLDLCNLRQGTTPVHEPVECRVERLQIEQAQLVVGRCLHAATVSAYSATVSRPIM